MARLDYDVIWPPSARRKLEAPLKEVLARLPQRAFDYCYDNIGFVAEDPAVEMIAVNPPSYGRTIVIFHTAWDFDGAALIGLLAHEIAHCFVSGRDYLEDERLTNSRAQAWGFGKELRALKRAKGKKER